MAVCFFNQEYDTRYKCDYLIENDYIEVNVEYDIGDEVEAINGMKSFGPNTTYDDRDILIADREAKQSFLLKDAFYNGSQNIWHVDGGNYTKFKSYCFFSNSSYEKLADLRPNPKVSTIRVYSQMVNSVYGHTSVKVQDKEDVLSINAIKRPEPQCLDIGSNNIKSVTIGDNWNASHGDAKVHIDILGYVEINLMRKVSYREVNKYINELLVFMQLYKPGRFIIDDVWVKVDKAYYTLWVPRHKIRESKTNVLRTVQVDLEEFLQVCYSRIPYRNSKTYIRNIPYIVTKTDRQVEDTFLVYYRLIESFWKSHDNKNAFIQHSLRHHYRSKTLSEDEIERLTYEIISLRNHYVHSGYYLRNNSLRIKYPKIGNKSNPKNYTKNNITVGWIVDLTLILKEISIDIIFREMLGYNEYTYNA